MRAFVYAIIIHVAFGAMLGVSLWIQPRTIMPVEGKPVQAKAIDLAAIQREKKKKLEAVAALVCFFVSASSCV